MGDFAHYDVTVSYSVMAPRAVAEITAKELPGLVARNARWVAGQLGAIASEAMVSMRLVPSEEPRG